MQPTTALSQISLSFSFAFVSEDELPSLNVNVSYHMFKNTLFINQRRWKKTVLRQEIPSSFNLRRKCSKLLNCMNFFSYLWSNFKNKTSKKYQKKKKIFLICCVLLKIGSIIFIVFFCLVDSEKSAAEKTSIELLNLFSI